MDQGDYYSDKKYCPKCEDYVQYLRSIHASYCTRCGGEVKLFSKHDWEKFNHESSSPKRRKDGFERDRA
ncbi:MAG: hypothetical protein R3F17_06975 [Planctomycetota bacterium]